MDAGSSGGKAYRLLVSELTRELDTNVCGAALQKLIAFRVGEAFLSQTATTVVSDQLFMTRKATDSLRQISTLYNRYLRANEHVVPDSV